MFIRWFLHIKVTQIDSHRYFPLFLALYVNHLIQSEYFIQFKADKIYLLFHNLTIFLFYEFALIKSYSQCNELFDMVQVKMLCVLSRISFKWNFNCFFISLLSIGTKFVGGKWFRRRRDVCESISFHGLDDVMWCNRMILYNKDNIEFIHIQRKKTRNTWKFVELRLSHLFAYHLNELIII